MNPGSVFTLALALSIYIVVALVTMWRGRWGT